MTNRRHKRVLPPLWYRAGLLYIKCWIIAMVLGITYHLIKDL